MPSDCQLLHWVKLAFGRLFFNHTWIGVCVLVWVFPCGLASSCCLIVGSCIYVFTYIEFQEQVCEINAEVNLLMRISILAQVIFAEGPHLLFMRPRRPCGNCKHCLPALLVALVRAIVFAMARLLIPSSVSPLVAPIWARRDDHFLSEVDYKRVHQQRMSTRSYLKLLEKEETVIVKSVRKIALCIVQFPQMD